MRAQINNAWAKLCSDGQVCDQIKLLDRTHTRMSITAVGALGYSEVNRTVLELEESNRFNQKLSQYSDTVNSWLLDSSSNTKPQSHTNRNKSSLSAPRPTSTQPTSTPLWRNWLARLTVNQEVGSSSLPGGDGERVTCYFDIALLCFWSFFYYLC